MTSETFFRAMSSIDKFRGDCEINSWLCAIAKNCYYSYLRKNRPTAAEDIPESLPDYDAVDPCDTIGDADDTMRLHSILHTLGEPYKEVFTLKVFGELSFKQIGELFAKSENWACVTYHRAKEKIRKLTEENK